MGRSDTGFVGVYGAERVAVVQGRLREAPGRQTPQPIEIKPQTYTKPSRGRKPPKNKLPKVPPPVVGLENNTDAHGRERRPPPRRREPRPEARQREARRRGAAEDEQRADAEAAVALVRPEEARGGAPRRTCAAYWWWVAAMASSWGRGSAVG